MNLAASVFRRLGIHRPPPPTWPPTFDDLADMPDSALIPAIDRPGIDETTLSPEQREWRRDGVVTLRKFIPDAVLAPYIARRERLREERPDHFLGGWYSPTPYEHIPEVRALSLHPPLMNMMEHLVGEPMMLHLNLTGWISTERNWHQDDYLNPPFVNSWYAAAWIALDDVGPDAGPFEFVPGSHRWKLMRQHKVQGCMTPDQVRAVDPVSNLLTWPRTSESFVVPAIEAEIAVRGAGLRQFIAAKGDVLLWHGRLIHRGSRPRNPKLQRRALIAHYSGVNHRPDMTRRNTDENGMAYFVPAIPLW